MLAANQSVKPAVLESSQLVTSGVWGGELVTPTRAARVQCLIYPPGAVGARSCHLGPTLRPTRLWGVADLDLESDPTRNSPDVSESLALPDPGRAHSTDMPQLQFRSQAQFPRCPAPWFPLGLVSGRGSRGALGVSPDFLRTAGRPRRLFLESLIRSLLGSTRGSPSGSECRTYLSNEVTHSPRRRRREVRASDGFYF